ncbi:hypothetical protein OG417_18655 [Actinoallomurus sp. NBC_01490]|uniref:hypothetical protein n=1 Tax=Actinoallomurus sp. NBC_01490 TaxID=2903557 RepID=UPI002E3356E0|nr:hypothetical protein [Actinoallomurus sp. NBC_01490]
MATGARTDMGIVPRLVTEHHLRARCDRPADVLATSLARRSVLCGLISAQSAVLERNIVVRRTTEVTISGLLARRRKEDA